MNKLNTRYLGFDLRSPLIVGSSGLTSSLSKLKQAEENEAGAVVLKSLFEEQINYSAGALSGTSDYPEAEDYILNYTRSNSVDEYLKLIRSAKESLSIPVIPSINCISSEGWTDFAKNVVSAGADALEVNVFFLPTDKHLPSSEAEKLYFKLLEDLRSKIKIPIVIKLGQRFSNLFYVVDQLHKRGANGVVLFNRFYEPDIDIERMDIVPSAVFSSEAERRYVLRWIAMASSQDIKIDISASTGVNTGEDAIRYLLAGADTVQVCSSLYKNGITHLKKISDEMVLWMDRKGFRSIDDFRGKLNWLNFENPATYERTQFMKYFSSEV